MSTADARDDGPSAPADDEPRFVSFAQNFEDVMLWRALGHVENGFYVDVGAQDPVLDSVSKAFYDRGWRGIDIEPVPAYAARLRAARPHNRVLECALSDRTGREPLFVFGDSGLSTLRADQAGRNHDRLGLTYETREVEVRTLRDVLAEVPHDVHWLKIDVEGAEAEVLESWRGSPVHPWIVIVEATRPNEPVLSHDGWEPILVEAGYAFVYFDGLNRFYVAPEHPELRAAFATPPNVFDRFTLAAVDRLGQSFLRAERYARSLEVEVSNQHEAQRALTTRRDAELQAATVYAASLRAELARAQAGIASHDDFVQRKDSALQEAAAYAQSLEQEVANRGARLAHLDDELVRMREMLGHTEVELASQRSVVVRRSAEFAEAATYATSLEGEVQKLQAAVGAHSEQIRVLDAAHAALERVAGDAEARRLAAEAATSALAQEVDALRAVLADWQELSMRQAAYAERRARDLAALLGTPDDDPAVAAPVEADIASARTAHETMRARDQRLDAEIGRIAAELRRHEQRWYHRLYRPRAHRHPS